MTKVVVSAHRHYPYPPRVMWRAFADPEVSTTFDDRVSLVSVRGERGSVGSSYELVLKLGALSASQTVTVREADEPNRLEAVTVMG